MNRQRTANVSVALGPGYGLRAVCIVFACLACSPLPADGPPMSGGDFTVTEYTVEGSGGRTTGSDFDVHASVAQTEAGQKTEGGAFELEGGFWPQFRGPGDTLFKDGFE